MSEIVKQKWFQVAFSAFCVGVLLLGVGYTTNSGLMSSETAQELISSSNALLKLQIQALQDNLTAVQGLLTEKWNPTFYATSDVFDYSILHPDGSNYELWYCQKKGSTGASVWNSLNSTAVMAAAAGNLSSLGGWICLNAGVAWNPLVAIPSGVFVVEYLNTTGITVYNSVGSSKINSSGITTTSLLVSTIQQAGTDGVKILNLIAENGTSFPSSPLNNQVFYRTDLGYLYIYNSTSVTWNPVGYTPNTYPYGNLTDVPVLLFANGSQELLASWNVGGTYGIYGAAWVNATSVNASQFFWSGANRTDTLAYPVAAYNYLIFKDGSTFKAKNGTDGTIAFSSTAAYTTINNAINAADARGKGLVHITAGTYNVTGGQIVIPHHAPDAGGATSENYTNIILQGAGLATKIVSNDVNRHMVLFNGTGNSNSVVTGVTIQQMWLQGGGGFSGSGNGIHLDHCQFIKSFDMTISNFPNMSICSEGASNLWVENNQLQYCTAGIYTTGHDSTFYNNKITNMRYSSVSSSGEMNSYSMNTFEDLDSSSGKMFIITGWSNTLYGNWFNNENNDLIFMIGTSGAHSDNIITANHLYGPSPNNASSVSAGIWLSSATYYSVSDNSISGFKYGIEVVGSSSINNSFTRNIVKNSATWDVYGHADASMYNYFLLNVFQSNKVYPYRFVFAGNSGYNDLPNMKPILTPFRNDGLAIGDPNAGYTWDVPHNNTVAMNYGSPKMFYLTGGSQVTVILNGATIVNNVASVSYASFRMDAFDTLNVIAGSMPTFKVMGVFI